MAGIYNGHLLEFPTIRVDCFLPSTSSTLLPSLPTCPTHPYPLRPAPNAQLFLLTHVHSDHLMGLSDAFTGKIICSPDTKRMLLALEAEVDRGFLEEGTKEVKRLKYPGLRKRKEGKGKDEKIVDRIEAVPYNYPKEYEIGYENGKLQAVTITLLDANHCPGSTIFLITSPTKAVLHTGDIRADKLFMQSLRREPMLHSFLAPISTYSGSTSSLGGGRRVLDRIYLDTGAILGTGDMPDREPVLQNLVEQMSLFPADTIFFLDTWCFGWEYVIKEVARYFDEPVHVDRYKRSIYTAIETDPYLLLCTTTDPHSTRFHACERTHKCVTCRRFEKGNRKPVYNLDKRIVSVSMVEAKEASWAMNHQAFLNNLGKAAIGEGPWPYDINVPLARHSPLPELQNLVKLFKPKAVSPNTVTAGIKAMDYYLLPDFMQECITEDAYEVMIKERNLYFDEKYDKEFLAGLKGIQASGTDVTPNKASHPHDLSAKTAIDKPSRQSSSRSSMSKEQMFRISGLPALKPDELLQMIGAGISHGMIEPTVSGARHVDEYDTDEESGGNKRRRILYQQEQSQDFKPESSPSIIIKREHDESLKIKCTSSPPRVITSPKSNLPSADSSITSTKHRKSIAVARDKKPSKFALGSDDKERIRKLMDRDREAFVGFGHGDDQDC
ncbi:uncharacterized protein L201_000746 [Kwoniella dendrophila CBS 6074]|uniref:Metallo-beta-lactamase domain-containing protein n=1 Tax=Kwoniella dendrophila CBS 6074 TaxID=1295534 RepID=A0AAX4JLW9_9TREE